MLQRIYIPKEIYIIIFNNLSFQEVLPLRSVNKEFENIFQLYVECNEVKFYEWINDKVLENLSFSVNCININLSGCSDITDNGLRYLANCTTIDLSACKRITDSGLRYLVNCTINLRNCNKITDDGLKYLTNCTTITLPTYLNLIELLCARP